MKNIVLLNKDKTCSVIGVHTPFDYSGVKYVLIPIIRYGTHLMLKSNKYLDFTKVKISYSMLITTMDIGYHMDDIEDDEVVTHALSVVDVEYDNIFDLYNTLHSLSRMDYSNSILNAYEYDADSVYLLVGAISITFWKNNEITFHTEYDNMDNIFRLVYHHLPIDHYLRDIYDTINSKNDKCLIIKGGKWYFNKYLVEDSLIGIFLIDSRSVYITTDDILDIIGTIDYIEYYNYIISVDKPEVINELNARIQVENITESFMDYTEGIEIFNMKGANINGMLNHNISSKHVKSDSYLYGLQNVVDFLSYIYNYINTSVFVFNQLYNPGDTSYMDTILNIHIYYKDKDLFLSVNRNKCFSLKDIIKMIVNGKGD